MRDSGLGFRRVRHPLVFLLVLALLLAHFLALLQFLLQVLLMLRSTQFGFSIRLKLGFPLDSKTIWVFR